MKQDRNGVRTAQDLERKYDFSSIDTLKRNYELQKTSLNKVENELNDFVSATTQNIEELQNQVDGNITTWFSSGIPTLNNYPANEWEDDDTRNNHLGDLYYDRETGYAYRFTLEENTYQWIDIKDTDVTQALALANAAQDTADSKRRVFVAQPAPPYDVGDLWLNNEELYRCQITKSKSESYTERDWIKATKYTDDTVAYQVDGKLTILSGTVTEIVDNVDELSTKMTNTTRLVNEQGETIGTLQEQQSSTSQTVSEISSTVSSVSNRVDTQGNTIANLSTQIGTNTSNITTLKSNVTSLQQTDTEISGRVATNANKIGTIESSIVPTKDTSGSSIYIEDSTNAELVNFEMEGKTTQATSDNPVMPSPDYPSELVSVGYKNLFDNQFRQGGASNLSTTNRLYSQNDIYVEQGKTYTISTNLDITIFRYAINIAIQPHPYSSQAQDSNWKKVSSFTFTANLSGYLGIPISKIANTDITLDDIDSVWFQVVEGLKTYSYIPYGKYGIEIKTQNKNLFDGVLEQGSVNSQGINNTNTTRLRTKNYISVYPNTTYALKVNENTTGKNLQFSISYYDKNDYTTYRLSYLNWTTSNPITFTTPNDCHYIRFLIAYTNGSTINTTDNISKIQIEKTQATTYEEYKSKTYLYTLNQPLRSIGDTKDLLYIKNGMLYVERKIGSVVLNGSEVGWSNQGGQAPYSLIVDNLKTINSQVMVKSSNFMGVPYSSSWTIYNALVSTSTASASVKLIKFRYVDMATLDNFKSWLSTHNTEINYILAEPYTEELGQVDMPNTYKTITYIDTTDELEPNMNITYVRDTQITNYVEQHISQIIVNEEGITQRVENIENNGLEDRITTVETQQTSTDFRINAISKNVTFTEFDEDGNPINSNINSVTTTTGFTFNENGLNIKKSDTDYNTLIDNTGTYYKDGETIISMTNKDGFLAKDFRLQGQHYYSYNANNPSEPLASENYDFVDERIEVEVDGQTQYAYATFYNGEV